MHPSEITKKDKLKSVKIYLPFLKLYKKLLKWTVSFANSKHSSVALFLVSFADSSFFPIAPDVLLAPLCLTERKKSLWFGTMASFGSFVGALFGYLIGLFTFDFAINILNLDQENLISIDKEFDKNGAMYVFLGAFTPLPFKLVTIPAGFARMNFLVFTIICLLGRSFRFYSVAWLFWYIGPKATTVIMRLNNKLIWSIITIIIIALLLFLKFK